MDYETQINRLMNRKSVKSILGDSYVLNDCQKKRLCKLLDVYKTPKKMENMLTTLANFILYDLTNYVGRYRRLLGITGTSKYTQILRYGRHWKTVYDLQSYKKTKHFQNTLQHWINQGYSTNQAKEKVREIQTSRSIKSVKKTKGVSLYTVRSIKYWINNGYSEEEAREKVCKIQTTNGLEFYKEKYPQDYDEKFKERISKWQQSYSSNDLEKINLKKSHSIDGALARGLTYDEAVKVQQKNIEHLTTIRKVPSKISQKFCNMLETKLTGVCYYAEKNYEKLISGYRVDFYHKDTKTAIEFYGDFYHRNPKLFESDHLVFGVSASEKWKYDRAREIKIKQSKNVDNFFIVWESDFRKNPEKIINEIIEEIS